MKKLMLAMMAILMSGPLHADEPGDLVTLISRYVQGGSYERTATYSFRALTHDVNKTRNNWDILLEARNDFDKDTFRVNTVTDDRSEIFDLSKSAPSSDCKDNRYQSRSSNDENDMIEVVEGHTYMIMGSDSDGSVRVTFRVLKHVKGLLAILSDVQVLSQSGSPNIQKARR